MSYKVVEKFTSINGEGLRAGEPAVFIRFAGCNLNCNYCDTSWANQPEVVFEPMTAEGIYNYIINTGLKNVTLTGGEPLLQENITDLLLLLGRNPNLRIEIETNGSIDLAPYYRLNIKNLVFTMDYKLPLSRMEQQMLISNLDYLSELDVLKFVVQNVTELKHIDEFITKYDLIEKTNLLISPVYGAINPDTIVQYMLEHGQNDLRIQLQLHKIIWGQESRGV
jgi:7-carboxy-7-deazaguanine synthase